MLSLQNICNHDIKLSTASQIFAIHGGAIFQSLKVRWSKQLFIFIYDYFLEVLDCFVNNLDILYPTKEK